MRVTDRLSRVTPLFSRITGVPARSDTHAFSVFRRSVTHDHSKTGVKIAYRPKKRVITRLKLTLPIASDATKLISLATKIHPDRFLQ
jgi:hypothetical protein